MQLFGRTTHEYRYTFTYFKDGADEEANDEHELVALDVRHGVAVVRRKGEVAREVAARTEARAVQLARAALRVEATRENFRGGHLLRAVEHL